MNNRTIRIVYGLFLAVCVVIGFVTIAAWRNIGAATASADWVNHTHATIYELDRVVSSLVAGDGAARTYVWTGERRELVQARGEFEEMTDHFETLKALTRDDAAVRSQVEELGPLLEKHAAVAAALMKTREGKGSPDLGALSQTDSGIGDLDDVKRRATKIRAEQFELLNQRDHEAYLRAQTTRWIVGTGTVLDLVLLVGMAWLIRDDLAARRRLTEQLQADNELLEAKVKERTRDLAAANASLTAENLERKWAAQALEHQLRYSQIIVNATGELVFVVSKALAVIRINPATSDRTGWPEEEILGRPLGNWLLGGDAIGPALRSGREIHRQPVRVTTRQTGELAATFTLLPIRDNDKVVGGVVLVQLTPVGPVNA